MQSISQVSMFFVQYSSETAENCVWPWLERKPQSTTYLLLPHTHISGIRSRQVRSVRDRRSIHTVIPMETITAVGREEWVAASLFEIPRDAAKQVGGGGGQGVRKARERSRDRGTYNSDNANTTLLLANVQSVFTV